MCNLRLLAIDAIWKRGAIPVLVGGTGLYVWGVTEGPDLVRELVDLGTRFDLEAIGRRARNAGAAFVLDAPDQSAEPVPAGQVIDPPSEFALPAADLFGLPHADAAAAALVTLIAITFGALAAYAGGWVDTVITGAADIVLTIPGFPLLAVLAAFVRLNNPLLLAGLIGILGWPVLLRAVRGQVLSLKERDYVEAARSLDLGTAHVLFNEILPNMRAYIAIYFVLSMTQAIYSQVGLYLLGFAPLSGDNWGIMLNLAWYRGAIFYKNSFWYIMGPIVAISLVQLLMVTMTRSLEEAFNPRLRRAG